MESVRSSLAGLTIRLGLTLIACVVLAALAESAPQEKSFVLGRGSERLVLSADGALQSWGDLSARIEAANPSSAGEIRYAGNILKLRRPDRKSTRLNSSHLGISYAVFCLK